MYWIVCLSCHVHVYTPVLLWKWLHVHKSCKVRHSEISKTDTKSSHFQTMTEYLKQKVKKLYFIVSNINNFLYKKYISVKELFFLPYLWYSPAIMSSLCNSCQFTLGAYANRYFLGCSVREAIILVCFVTYVLWYFFDVVIVHGNVPA